MRLSAETHPLRFGCIRPTRMPSSAFEGGTSISRGAVRNGMAGVGMAFVALPGGGMSSVKQLLKSLAWRREARCAEYREFFARDAAKSGTPG
jgi:hypothetical protein